MYDETRLNLNRQLFESVMRSLKEAGSEREADDNNITEFNDWIADLEVEEVSCVGRKFTWYKPNGAAKRKLDRFFVSDEWISKWPGVTR